MLFIFCQENRNNCLVIKFIIIKVIQFINILLIKPKRYGLELKTSFQMENSLQMTVYITIFIWQCTLGFTCFSYLLRRRHSIYSLKNDSVFLDIRPSVLQLFRPTSICVSTTAIGPISTFVGWIWAIFAALIFVGRMDTFCGVQWAIIVGLMGKIVVWAIFVGQNGHFLQTNAHTYYKSNVHEHVK